MLIDYIRQVHSSTKFKLEDTFKFKEFDEITSKEIVETDPVPESIEIWAAIQVSYEGEIPDSYKVLNLMIGDWVAKNEKELTKVIHEKLKDHFSENYPDSDTSELSNIEESVIWLDQLDYMPRINEDKKQLTIEIELVVDAEPIDEE